MKRIALLSVILLYAGALMAQQTYTFARRGAVEMKMDVYQPAAPRADHACVLYVFGGGFFSGARNDKSSVLACTRLAERGFVAVAIDYRLYLANAPKVPLLKMYSIFDTAIRYGVEDCSDAIAYLCQHADELHVDPARIILTGSSAGAITVMQTDYSRCNALPAAAALPQGFRPAAVIPYAGAILCRNNALKYATPPAPTCMFHGTGDKIVNYKRFRGAIHTSLFGANSLAKVFKKQGYNYWIMRYPNLGHDIAVVLPQTLDEFCAFVDAALSGRVMQFDATCRDSRIQPSKWSKMNIFDLYFGGK
ncbi:MAG: alpha/beta hydrolase [Bacteroidales bacterium]|nr:alpha/beta hydrolase [Bacteroidales bacterium]